ncbi:hypothetical protein [Streptomyces sp. cmx-4-9]|uniref:hypothetical protein n=1 Tax=Streptomyces sp. cmx-4-9 TaxID=2790941 RepID=UPI00397ED942
MLNRNHRSEAITELLAEAETRDEAAALVQIALRAGYLWRCATCREDQYPSTNTCPCGTDRADAAGAPRA